MRARWLPFKVVIKYKGGLLDLQVNQVEAVVIDERTSLLRIGPNSQGKGFFRKGLVFATLYFLLNFQMVPIS
jgi:hypothetical protein